MPEPQSLVKTMNTLAMEMTQCSRNRQGKKVRKRVFRKMKSHLKMVVRHAERYHRLLEEKWRSTEWTEKQTGQVLERMNNVIEQIPSIISVAHSRIISGKKLTNEEKILSLYEKDVHVIKRGKSGADVEFGNGFYLAEQRDGLVIDFDYFKQYPPADSDILKESVKRVKSRYTIKLLAGDRAFNTKRNDRYLEEENIFNATCPKNPEELAIKIDDERFREAQKRRAQTEGRIGIFKNKFIGVKLQRKGYENRELKMVWTVFTHNLWIIARLAISNGKQQSEALPLAA
jgi:hypothetical protein